MDNYVLTERLGQGSFAVVWKARRKNDGRVVAVKQLKTAPATWEECKRLPEIRAAAAVRSHNVISLLEAVRHGNELFLVFEYADSDLYRCLGPSKRLEEPQVRWVMRQLLAGLAAVHAAGLVHCDVKPENLLLWSRSGPENSPVLKLCDLGQAASNGDVQTYVGTRWYRAPELLMESGVVSPEIDLWAAGSAMTELLLCRPPFPGTSTRDMLFRICSALGAPEDGWYLSDQLMEASGLRFAPCIAEGPIWFELSSAGASHSAVELVRGLLRYDHARRIPAARALSSDFFAEGLQEVPVTAPHASGDRRGTRNPETLQRAREEAKAAERKLQAHAAALGVGGFTAAAASQQGQQSTALCPAGEDWWEPAAATRFSDIRAGPSDNTGTPMARRAMQASSSTGTLSAKSRREARMPTDPLSSASSAVRGLSPGSASRPTSSSTSAIVSIKTEAHNGRGARVGAQSWQGPRMESLRESGENGDAGEDDADEELAALFWNQVESSRGVPLPGSSRAQARSARVAPTGVAALDERGPCRDQRQVDGAVLLQGHGHIPDVLSRQQRRPRRGVAAWEGGDQGEHAQVAGVSPPGPAAEFDPGDLLAEIAASSRPPSAATSLAGLA